MSDPRIANLIEECERQEESCLYTAAALYIWQKRARFWRNFFIVAPIVLAGIASSQIFVDIQSTTEKLIAVSLSVLAGFFPTIYVALGMDMRVAEIGQSASEFTNIRDRFRQAARVKSHAPFDEFDATFEQLMDRLDAARKSAPATPDWCFRRAQGNIKKGDYSFAADKKR